MFKHVIKQRVLAAVKIQSMKNDLGDTEEDFAVQTQFGPFSLALRVGYAIAFLFAHSHLVWATR